MGVLDDYHYSTQTGGTRALNSSGSPDDRGTKSSTPTRATNSSGSPDDRGTRAPVSSRPTNSSGSPDDRDSGPAVSLASGNNGGGSTRNTSGSPDDRDVRNGGTGVAVSLASGGSNKTPLSEIELNPMRVQTFNQPIAPSPLSPLVNFFADSQAHRDEKIAERAAAGVTPSAGPIDWNAMLYDANTPARERGVNYEGGIDWNGIGAALGNATGGIGSALANITSGMGNDAPRLITPATAGLLRNTSGSPDDRSPAPVVPDRLAPDPESGFLPDPRTGAYYAPEYMPDWQRQAQTSTADAVARAASNGSLSGLQPPSERIVQSVPVDEAAYQPGQPEIIPAATAAVAGIDAAPAVAQVYPGLEGMVPGARPAVPTAAQPAQPEPSVWDNVVDMSGKVLEHTALGGIVKEMFPDFWYGAGEAFKHPSGHSDPNDIPRSLASGPAASDTPIKNIIFIDANHNGINDLDEKTPVGTDTPDQPKPTKPTTKPTGTSPYDRNGDVVFPDFKTYNPGVDAEHLYFRRHGYAEGGIVDALPPEGGPQGNPMSGLDPRVAVISAAEDALEGQSPNPEQALRAFVDAFGEPALEQLAAQVKEGMTLKRKQPRMIEGPGGPTDDAVPARIDNGQEAALSNGEFVMTADAVANAGDGDPRAGADKLMQLNEMLSKKGPGAQARAQ